MLPISAYVKMIDKNLTSTFNIRPLDGTIIETDIIQHPNKDDNITNNFNAGPRVCGWALTRLKNGEITSRNDVTYLIPIE